MTTAQELKLALVESASEQLGTYMFRGNQATPAIRIDDGSDPLPEDPAVEGLEVVIVPSLDVPVTVMMGGYKETRTTLIVLKQWDIQETTNSARSKVLAALLQFQDLTVGQIVKTIRSTALDNIETCRIPVTEFVWIPEEE